MIINDITTPFNQVHLMQKLVNMQLDASKTASEHLNIYRYSESVAEGCKL